MLVFLGEALATDPKFVFLGTPSVERAYACVLLDRKMCPKKATRAGSVPKKPAQNHLFSYQPFVTAWCFFEIR